MAQSKPDQNTPAKKSDAALREERILAFWKEHKTFQKSLEKDAPGGDFVFYDGPPFATGLPHYGHLLAGTIKDAIPRYQTMRGKRVLRRWGWDCHGLPIENLIEKELNLSTKKEIEALGIETFNEAARSRILQYDKDWQRIVPRTGRWIDMDRPYLTMQPSYMESIWWSFKTLFEKKLIYQGFKSMHLCPRCETTLSNFEVNLGYKDITDISVYVKFKQKDADNTYFLAWTTTPWTLPGNVALAVHPDVMYVTVEADTDNGQERYILAESLFEKHAAKFTNPKIVATQKGSELVGSAYEPLFDYYARDQRLPGRENGWKVYAGEFVTTEEGTGIVHIAPAFGDEDMQLGKTHNLPFVQHVTTTGVFKSEVTDFAGMPVKPKSDEPQGHQATDIAIIKHLAAQGSLFAKEKIIHSYPHCWRCDTPLLNYASSSWFVQIAALKDRMIAENNTVGWTPPEIGSGRFGKWLEGARDWAISRSRYWGATLPIWRCEKCDAQEVMGSFDDIRAKTGRGNTFILVRHGQAESNVNRVYASHDKPIIHLTDTGKEQIAAAAKEIAKHTVNAIYASPLVRIQESAAIIAEATGATVTTDDRLHEINVGPFDGKSDGEYYHYFGSYDEWFTKKLEGGENGAELRQRVGEFLYEIDARHQNETIVIVSHDYPLGMLEAVIYGLDQRETIDLANARDDFFANAEHKVLPFAAWPHNRWYERDLHRPYIDEVTFACSCGGTMKRIPDVFDTWYESGSMPYASNHYPFKTDTTNPPQGQRFPADFIAEGLDQTRGWFYTLLALSVGLFDRTPYKNVIVNGLVLAEDGRKMSKRLQNYPEVEDVLNNYGADVMRYYMLASQAMRAEDLLFSERGLDEVSKKILGRLLNVVSFYELYADGVKATGELPQKPQHILDTWIISRLNSTIATITAGFDSYELDRATRPIADFVDDLSVWYLRRSRDRFKNNQEKDAARQCLGAVLVTVAKVIAPHMPFVAEDIYQRVTKGAAEESVHLDTWPTAGTPDATVEEQMQRVRLLVTNALALRIQVKLAVRQPLATLQYGGVQLPPEYEALIADEVNVKTIEHQSKNDEPTWVWLDTELTDSLKREGYARELMRAVQDARKKAQLTPHDSIVLTVAANELGQAVLAEFATDIQKVIGAREIQQTTETIADNILELDDFLVAFRLS